MTSLRVMSSNLAGSDAISEYDSILQLSGYEQYQLCQPILLLRLSPFSKVFSVQRIVWRLDYRFGAHVLIDFVDCC